jgi:hypothetical protein
MVRTTKQHEDTQIEIAVDHHSDQYSVMVTSGASSRLEAVIAVPGSRSKELADSNRSTSKARRADTVRYKSPIKENRNSALIGRHGVSGRRRDRDSSCPPSFRTSRPLESRNSAFTPMRDEQQPDETMMRRRESSCPPDFEREAPDEILASNRRGDDLSAAPVKSAMIFQKYAVSTRNRKPNLVTAVASNKAIFLSRVVKKRVIPTK